MTAALTGLFVFGVAGFIAFMVIYEAMVLWLLWGWFIAPLGVPQIGIAWAAGIACVAGIFATTPPRPKDEDAGKPLTALLLKPAILLIVGFIAKLFM